MKLIETPWPDVLVARDLPSTEGWFTDEELRVADAFKLDKRRDEWLLSRAVAKRLAADLGICADPHVCAVTRPRLIIEGQDSEWFVSLSHSTPYAGAAIARAPIGLDVQVLRDLPEAAAHLFLTEEEEAAMKECRTPHRILHFWCAKEAAWKKRGGEIPTLKAVPLTLVRDTSGGIAFESAESLQVGDVIVALAR